MEIHNLIEIRLYKFVLHCMLPTSNPNLDMSNSVSPQKKHTTHTNLHNPHKSPQSTQPPPGHVGSIVLDDLWHCRRWPTCLRSQWPHTRRRHQWLDQCYGRLGHFHPGSHTRWCWCMRFRNSFLRSPSNGNVSPPCGKLVFQSLSLEEILWIQTISNTLHYVYNQVFVLKKVYECRQYQTHCITSTIKSLSWRRSMNADNIKHTALRLQSSLCLEEGLWMQTISNTLLYVYNQVFVLKKVYECRQYQTHIIRWT